MDYYAFAIPNMPTNMIGKNKRTWDEMTKILKNLEGFYGVYPHYPDGTILFFKTLNSAKAARNILRHRINHVGKYICTAEEDETGTMTIGLPVVD